ncbi:MAG: hypothetical protein OXC99_06670 [Chloroflexi bacterium]|nr:hypothetical protein [Chloroflexota bacterium]
MNAAEFERLLGPAGDPAVSASLYVTNPLDALREVNADAAERLSLFAKLGFGWRDDDSLPIPQAAISSAACLLLLADRLYGNRIAEPLVVPVVDGSVEVDWDGTSGEELVLMVPPEGAPIQFVMNLPDGSGGVTEWDGFLPTDASLADLLTRLT